MALQFVRGDANKAKSLLLTRLASELKTKQRVLWIVPGGSNIALVAEIMKEISEDDSVHLAVMLSDERFGPVGHPDSNIKQLSDAGFEPKQATVLPILRAGVSLVDTTDLYGDAAQAAFEAADTVIAHLGMGADGHIAGILPGTVATHPSSAWTIAYKTPEFTRITLSPFALRHVSEAFVVAFGDSKHEALQNLHDKSLPLTEQPAQLLKELPAVTIINDQIGSTL